MFWCLIVVDSKQSKAMIEFRLNFSPKSMLLNNETLREPSDSSPICRFCGLIKKNDFLESNEDLINVCHSEECDIYASYSCNRKLGCGHYCFGIADDKYSKCLPCLQGCSHELKQDGDDMCMICFSESIQSAPCIQLTCQHVFHFHCVKTVLEKRWSGARITFNFSLCPICKSPIEHPALRSLLDPINVLFKEVKQKALMRLEYEGLNRCEAITSTSSRYFEDPISFALER